MLLGVFPPRSQASLALRMLPHATEKQMLFWWQELGGQLLASTRHPGAWAKAQFPPFLLRLFHSRKAGGQEKEARHTGKELAPGALPRFPEGEERGFGRTHQLHFPSRKGSWSPQRWLLHADKLPNQMLAGPQGAGPPKCWASKVLGPQTLAKQPQGLAAPSPTCGPQDTGPTCRGCFHTFRLDMGRISPNGTSRGAIQQLYLQDFFFLRFYLFIHERHRKRGRDTGRGRSRLHAGSPIWDSILGRQDHALGQRQALNH